MSGVDKIFVIKLVYVIGIFLMITSLFNVIMRRYLKLEKRSMFSSSHVNKNHKKIDRKIVFIYIIITIILSYMGIYKYNNEGVWKFIPAISALMLIVVSQMTKAFMEWKYSVNPKEYIFTLSQLIFLMILFWITVKSSFFNLF